MAAIQPIGDPKDRRETFDPAAQLFLELTVSLVLPKRMCPAVITRDVGDCHLLDRRNAKQLRVDDQMI